MMFSGAAAFYGVVLAFVIVAAWQNFQDAAQREQTELLALTELYEVGTRMPPPTQPANDHRDPRLRKRFSDVRMVR